MTVIDTFTGYTQDQIITYLHRIGFWDFERLPEPKHDTPLDTIPRVDYTTLHRICYCQGHSIPFGNLSYIYYKRVAHQESNYPPNPKDPLTTQGVSTDPRDIFNKLVVQKREGYCFEGNLLANFMLRAIGYESHIIGGRVAKTLDWDQRGEVILNAMTHMITLVYLGENHEDVYFVDVSAHIGQTVTPMKFIENEVQNTSPFYQNRLVRAPYAGDFEESGLKKNWPYVMQVKYRPIAGLPHHNRNEWTPVHYSHPSPLYLKDIRILNDSLVQDGGNVFHNNITLTTNRSNGYATLSNTKLKVYSKEGCISTDLLTEQERREAYEEYFNVSVPLDLEEHLPFLN